MVGLCTAPLLTTVLIAIQNLVPAGRAAEAYGINTASLGAGYALAGITVATLPVQAGLYTSLASIAACGAGALLLRHKPHRAPPAAIR